MLPNIPNSVSQSPGFGLSGISTAQSSSFIPVPHMPGTILQSNVQGYRTGGVDQRLYMPASPILQQGTVTRYNDLSGGVQHPALSQHALPFGHPRQTLISIPVSSAISGARFTNNLPNMNVIDHTSVNMTKDTGQRLLYEGNTVRNSVSDPVNLRLVGMPLDSQMGLPLNYSHPRAQPGVFVENERRQSESGSWDRNVPHIFPWAQPVESGMMFSAGTLPDSISNLRRSTARKRRSSEFTDVDSPSLSKYQATEERMAAKMRQLSISPYRRTDAQTVMDEIDSRLYVEEDFEESAINNNDLNTESKKEQLVLSEIVKSHLEKPNEILPKSVMEKIGASCMQVVLWKPPGGVVPKLINEDMSTDEILQKTTNGQDGATIEDVVCDVLPSGLSCLTTDVTNIGKQTEDDVFDINEDEDMDL